MANLEKFVRDGLHSALGFSDKNVAQFVLSVRAREEGAGGARLGGFYQALCRVPLSNSQAPARQALTRACLLCVHRAHHRRPRAQRTNLR